MQVAERQLLARQGDVDDLVAQPPVELLACEHRAAFRDGGLEVAAYAVQQHAALAVAHPAERLGELRLAPEVLDARVVELGLAGRAGDRGRASVSYADQSTAATLSIAILLRSRVGT